MRPHEHTKIIILADLGKFRAFRLSPPNQKGVNHAGPASVFELNIPKADWNSDRPSRFPIGSKADEASPMSPGENHNETTEQEKRRIHYIAELIEKILNEEEIKLWCFSAPAAINARILKHLSSETLSFLEQNIKLDLTHITLKELENRFLAHTSH